MVIYTKRNGKIACLPPVSVSGENVGVSRPETWGAQRTSATPTHGCPMGRHFLSSTNERCSGSGTRAEIGSSLEVDCRLRHEIRTLQIPHAALHSSLVADTWFAWQSIPALWEGRVMGHTKRKRRRQRTKIHDMISADGAVINDDVWSKGG